MSEKISLDSSDRFYVFFNVQMHEAPGELPRRRLFL